MRGTGLDNQETTLQSYEQEWERYIYQTRTKPVSEGWRRWLRDALVAAPGTGVLEIGTAHGRDAKTLEEYGATVQRTDAVDAFVIYLIDSGYPARKLNVLTDEPLSEPVDMVLASAVFHHFTDTQLTEALRWCKASLKPNGVLAFAHRRGHGDEWETSKLGTARYFRYRQPWDLWQAVEDDTFFRVETMRAEIWDPERQWKLGHADYPSHWVMVTARR